MADEEKESSPESGGDDKAKKGGLLKDWKGLKGWQKAGVIIGGGALVVAIAMYYKQSQTPANGAQPSGTPGSYGPSEYPGEGDFFPPVAPTPPTTTPTPPSPTPGPKPKKPPTGGKPKPGPKPPIPVHPIPQKPPVRRVPLGAKPKVTVGQWRAVAQRMGIKTTPQGKFVQRTGGYQRA